MKKISFTICFILLFSQLATSFAVAQTVSEEVTVWTPPFNTTMNRISLRYAPLTRAQKMWKICTTIPHLKDAYWLSVNYSLIDEAKRLGVALSLSEAGSYDDINMQRMQIEQCMDSGADALIIGAVQYDGLDDLIDKYTAKGIPVVDLINGIRSDKITARVAATYQDLGKIVGEYLVEEQKKQPASLKVVWLPGPERTGWKSEADKGFHTAIDSSRVRLVSTKCGDTGREEQKRLVLEALQENADIDYIVGNAVAAEAALEIVRQKGLTGKIKILPYYYGPGIHKGIQRGLFPGAPSDRPGIQARIALDTVTRALEGKNYYKHLGAAVEMVTKDTVKDFDELSSIPPSGFNPIFSTGKW